MGRRIGPAPFERYGHLVGLTPDRLRKLQSFIRRRGAFGVFVARFLPGLRSAAGPIAGMLGLPFPTFAAANVAGAVAYVPLAVGVGYGFSQILGPLLVWFEHAVGPVEHVVLVLVVLAPVSIVLWRRRRVRSSSR
jgi:membrane protein DedA with SNARE-associated domain